MKPLTLIRFGLPAVLGALGVALILSGDDAAVGAGVVIVGCAGLVSLANLLVRFSVGEMQDRTRDQDARDFYLAHGRWPDDPEPQSAPAAGAAAATPSPSGGHPGVISRPVADQAGRRR
ncbi:MAG: hypothetical protein H0V26_13610, partial [Solirubrobacterales bacterium]|nr:hypothetical protein [Solirubrobacterales bacterium]